MSKACKPAQCLSCCKCDMYSNASSVGIRRPRKQSKCCRPFVLSGRSDFSLREGLAQESDGSDMGNSQSQSR